MTSTELQNLADSFHPMIAKLGAKEKASEVHELDFRYVKESLRVAFLNLSSAAEELAKLESKGETL